MKRTFFQCIRNITIGNGAGKWSFQDHERFTEKDLQSACLTKGQIHAYFKRVEIEVSERQPHSKFVKA